jgi:hypothetical protein
MPRDYSPETLERRRKLLQRGRRLLSAFRHKKLRAKQLQESAETFPNNKYGEVQGALHTVCAEILSTPQRHNGAKNDPEELPSTPPPRMEMDDGPQSYADFTPDWSLARAHRARLTAFKATTGLSSSDQRDSMLGSSKLDSPVNFFRLPSFRSVHTNANADFSRTILLINPADIQFSRKCRL